MNTGGFWYSRLFSTVSLFSRIRWMSVHPSVTLTTVNDASLTRGPDTLSFFQHLQNRIGILSANIDELVIS